MRRAMGYLGSAALLAAAGAFAQDFGTNGIATFQGRLTNRGSAGSGPHDIGLLATTTGDVPVGGFNYTDVVPGPGGVISLDFDYGSLLIGGGGTLDPSAPVFIEIRVRRSGDPAFTTLAPKLPLRTAPRALGAQFAQLAMSTGASSVNSAAIVDGSLAAVDLAPGAIGAAQIDATQVQRRIAVGCPGANQSIKTIADDGGVSCEPDDMSAGWSLTGNADAAAGTSFLGTTNSVPLELRVNGARVGLYEDRSQFGHSAPVVVGGAPNNLADAGTVGGTICGGGGIDAELGAQPNRARGDWATVCGGARNSAGNGAPGPDGAFATVAGGQGNAAGAGHATVGGGFANAAIANHATVGGGISNSASAAYATIAGGAGGTASGPGATVGGGIGNRALGVYATVPGGDSLLAGGDFSVAMGRRAKVRDGGSGPYGSNEPGCMLGFCGDEGSFAYADSQFADFLSSGPNQFLVRAAGGFGLNTAAPRADLHVFAGSAGIGFSAPLPGTEALIEGAGNTRLSIVTPAAAERGIAFMDPTGVTSGLIRYNPAGNVNGFNFEVNGVGRGLGILANRQVVVDAFLSGPAGTLQVLGNLDVAGSITAANCCAAPSDARLKRDVAPIAHALERLLDLRGVGFRYREDAPAWLPREAQFGFVAQDVEAVFPQWVADDPRGFKAVDARGFEALAVEAVRELKRGHDARLDALGRENAALRAENAALAARLERIERVLGGGLDAAPSR